MDAQSVSQWNSGDFSSWHFETSVSSFTGEEGKRGGTTTEPLTTEGHHRLILLTTGYKN